MSSSVLNFINHIHPPKVTERALNPIVTFGLGIITITLLLILIVTGILLMTYYVPTTNDAYGSIQEIENAVTFGSFLRALHRWSAHGMVLTAVLHLIRVLATRSYKQREINWLIGLMLLIFTLGMAFTGYLLPWDQLSYWAINVSASMFDYVPYGSWIKKFILGGDNVGQSALTRFYMLHVALLPLSIIIFLVLHLWRIRKEGGLAGSESYSSASIPSWPHLILREVALAFIVITAFSFTALILKAPLGPAADIHTPSNPEKAPWYFLGIQEMVSYSAPIGGFIFPFIIIFCLVLLPFLDKDKNDIDILHSSGKCRVLALASILISFLSMIIFEVLYYNHGSSIPNSEFFHELFNPACGMLLIAAFIFVIVKISKNSLKLAIFSSLISLMTAMIGFTIMGMMRGPNWIFYWPWERWPIVY